jgi:protein-tyrosine phosphatase
MNKDWFQNRLVVGGFPYKVNSRFDADLYSVVINVSNQYSFNNENLIVERFNRSYWFPMNECKFDMGLNSIYAACVILYRCEKRNLNTYLHCWAGINRSRTVQAAYYLMRTGEQFQQENSRFVNALYANCTHGYLPSMKEMENFLKILNERLEADTLCDGTLDLCKLK